MVRMHPKYRSKTTKDSQRLGSEEDPACISALPTRKKTPLPPRASSRKPPLPPYRFEGDKKSFPSSLVETAASKKTTGFKTRESREDHYSINGSSDDCTCSSTMSRGSINDRLSVKHSDLSSLSIPKLLKVLFGHHAYHVKDALSKVSLLCDEDNPHRERDRHDLCDLGGPMAIVQAMHKFPQDPIIQAESCGALLNLSVDSIGQDRVISAGAIEAIVTAMRNIPSDADIQELGCGALNNLFYGSKGGNHQTNVAFRCGVIETIMGALKLHANHKSGVQQSALCALCALYDRGEQMQEFILDSGGLIEASKATASLINCRKDTDNLGKIKQAYIEALELLLKEQFASDRQRKYSRTGIKAPKMPQTDGSFVVQRSNFDDTNSNDSRVNRLVSVKEDFNGFMSKLVDLVDEKLASSKN